MPAPIRNEESAGCADAGQEQTFGEKLLQQAAEGSPNRHADRHFMSASEGPHQQQIADVGAGDEQNERHYGGHDFERGQQGTRIVERSLPQCPELEIASTIRGGVVGLQPRRDRRDFSLRLGASDAGLESNVTFDPARAAVLELVSATFERFFHRCWHPKIHCPADEGSIKARGRYADDGMGDIVEVLHLANDLRVASKSLLPKVIADHHDGMGVASDIFAGFEAASKNGAHTDCIEIIRRDDAAGRDFSVVSDIECAAGNLADEKCVAQGAVSLQILKVGP